MLSEKQLTNSKVQISFWWIRIEALEGRLKQVLFMHLDKIREITFDLAVMKGWIKKFEDTSSVTFITRVFIF